MLISLEQKWESLAPEPLQAVFQLYDSSHPLDFYIGRDTTRKRLLLLVTPERPPYIRDMKAVRIESFRRDDGKWSLLLTLQEHALVPMFSLLCSDLIESSRRMSVPPEGALAFVLARLSGWRQLLERGSPELLPGSQVRGPWGGVFFLSELFALMGQADAVKAWVGPDRAYQDFQVPGMAWEIKTVRPDAQSVTIASEFQLRGSERNVHLVVLELADATNLAQAGAFSLNSLVEQTHHALASDHDTDELFAEQLGKAGYVLRVEYDSPVFVVQSTRIFTVDIGFPSITPEVLAPGVSHVGYDINLSACEAFLLPLSEIQNQRAR